MIKIDWQELLIEHGFLGFYGWRDITAEPGTDFSWYWIPGGFAANNINFK